MSAAPDSGGLERSLPSSRYRADNVFAVDFWDLVNRQHWSVCESVQEGISARVHDHGYCAPTEDSNLDNRRHVGDRAGKHLDGTIA